MPPKRNSAKKAPRPASTKKKQQQVSPNPTELKEVTNVPHSSTLHLYNMLRDQSESTDSIIDFIVGPNCGLENKHTWGCFPKESYSSFHMAVGACRLDVVQRLVSDYSVDTGEEPGQSTTALGRASSTGCLEMVKYLVEHCGHDVMAQGSNGTLRHCCSVEKSRSG